MTAICEFCENQLTFIELAIGLGVCDGCSCLLVGERREWWIERVRRLKQKPESPVKNSLDLVEIRQV